MLRILNAVRSVAPAHPCLCAILLVAVMPLAMVLAVGLATATVAVPAALVLGLV